jgi:voltage-gated potassium channel
MKRKKRAPKTEVEIIEDALENPRSKYFRFINDVLAITTLVSVLAIVLETVAAFSAYQALFTMIEYGATFLFTAEYLLRLHMAKKKWNYVLSFFGIIDLIAILPTYLGLGNFTFLKTTRVLRIIRLLRMVRLAKLAKIKKKEVSSLYGLNIQIYAVSLATALIGLGTLFYLFEGHQTDDIPSGMFWAFKAIIGGIPYAQPTTNAGMAVLIAARFCSMILLGLMLSLVGTILRKLLTGSEKDS